MAKKAAERPYFRSDYCSDAVNEMLSDTLKHLDFRQGSLRDFSSDRMEDIPRIPTGLAPLDKLLKIGGIPRKTIVELFGPPGGGKSFTAQMLMASATRGGEMCLYLDVEGGFNPQRAAEIGVDINLVHLQQEFMYGEQVLDFVCDVLYNPDYAKTHGGRLQPKPYAVVVIDSIAVLGSKEEMETDFAQTHDGPKERPGARGRMMSRYQPRLLRAINNSAGVWVEKMKVAFPTLGEVQPLDREHLEGSLVDKLDSTIVAREGYEPQALMEGIRLGDEWAAVQDGLLADGFDGDVVYLAQAVRDGDRKKFEKAVTKLNREVRDAAGSAIDELDRILRVMEDGTEIIRETLEPEVAEFERSVVHGKVIGIDDNGLSVVHHNPGPVVVAINQIRTGNLGGYMGPTEERPGGMALKFAAGTAIRIDQIKSKKDGEIVDPVTKETIGWRSRAKIVKSRYAVPHTTCEVTIPFTDGINPLSEFLEFCESQKLYGFIRNKHRIPREGPAHEGGKDPLINEADQEEFDILLLSEGLDYLQGRLEWSDDQMDPIRDVLMKKIEAYADEAYTPIGLEDDAGTGDDE